MSDRNTPDTENGAIKDPAEWTTGDEPMTGAQESYVHTLARKAGEEVPEEMTKAEAEQMGAQLSGMMAQMQEALKSMPPEQRAQMEAMMKNQKTKMNKYI